MERRNALRSNEVRQVGTSVNKLKDFELFANNKMAHTVLKLL